MKLKVEKEKIIHEMYIVLVKMLHIKIIYTENCT